MTVADESDFYSRQDLNHLLVAVLIFVASIECMSDMRKYKVTGKFDTSKMGENLSLVDIPCFTLGIWETKEIAERVAQNHRTWVSSNIDPASVRVVEYCD
jgi:hypothetical protein